MLVGGLGVSYLYDAMPQGLVHPGPNEKNLLGQIFDRETKREKNLEAVSSISTGIVLSPLFFALCNDSILY